MKKFADSNSSRDRLAARRTSPFAARLALSAGTLAALSMQAALPAFAAGGAGGDAIVSFGIVGGPGGTGFTGNPGGNGVFNGGGGGGGGAGGGNGGTGGGNGFDPAGAPGGTSASPDGAKGRDGGLASNGGGGGGGFGGFNGNGAGAAAISNNAPLSGNNGGKGGAGGNVFGTFPGAGGGGGAGGFGAIVTGAGASSNGGSITGGNGGAGGAAGERGTPFPPTPTPPPAGGNGGDGGTGVLFTASGASFVNTGSVVGGNGGVGGTGAGPLSGSGGSIGGPDGLAGLGGVGVSGAGLTVINSGTISGGIGRGVRANAVTFTGGTNIFELRGGSTVIGNVVAFSAADTFRLGGTTTSSLDVSQLGPAGQFRGFGINEKSGTSTWSLAGTSASAAPWTINGGLLSVDGSIASSSLITVNAGGTLGGTGIVGNTTVNGGTLSPGNSIGLLTVQGNLVFTAAASYMVEVSPSNADRTNVTGTATLGGATVNANFAAGSYINKQYTIVNATGGISGTFGSLVNSNVPANFTSSLSYDANNAYLNLALNFIPPPNMGLNVNQQNVANAIVGFFNANGTIPLVFGGLTAAGLTQISGEVVTASQQTTFDAMGLFMGLLTDPFIAGRGNPVTGGANAPQFADENDAASAYAANGKARTTSERDAYAAVYRKAPVMADPFAQRWSVWAAGYGGSQTTDGNTVLGSNNTRSSLGGVAVGADYRVSPYTLAGFAIAGGGTNFSVNGLGSGRSDLFQAGAFVRHNVGAAYLTGALAYGWQDITTDRTVTVAGTDLLRANFNANAWSGRVEGGYRFVAPWLGVGLTPYAAGQFTTFDLPAYAEQAIAGANTFALTYASKSVTDTRSELGIRSDKSFAVQDGIFTLRGRAAWAHDFNPDRSIGATFQTLPGASFVVNGATHAADSALVTASAEMKWLNGFSLAGTFEGEFSNVTTSYAGKGVVRYAW